MITFLFLDDVLKKTANTCPDVTGWPEAFVLVVLVIVVGYVVARAIS